MAPKTIAIGNHNCGKSSLLNSLAEENLFKSSSILHQLEEKTSSKNGDIFIDTPGLDNIEFGDQAGKGTTEIMNKGGELKILFFITLDMGRINLEDVRSMKSVLEAAPDIGKKYGVIFNMISKRIFRDLKTDSIRVDYINVLFSGFPDQKKCDHSNITFFQRISELVDAKDIVVSTDQFKGLDGITLGQYIKEVPTISIKEGSVSSIQYLPYDEEIKINKELEKQLESLLESGIIGMEVCDDSGNKTKLPIDQVEDEILARIKKNIKFCLGHAVETNKLKDAMNKLFIRDYQDKKQIFVPQFFLPDHLNSIKDNIASKAAEKNVYWTLQNFFKNCEDQEVLVLNRHDLVYSKFPLIVDKDDYIKSDFIIVNKTHLYIFIIAVCTTNDLSKAIKQLQETKKLLKSRYGAYLEKWRFKSTIYWERKGATKNLNL